jgi:RNA recognition motif-containing protein
VGNLDYTTSDQELKDLFAAYGEVESVKIIKTAEGKARGFAFVEMAAEESAENAAKSLNQSTFKNRTLIVNEARDEVRRSDYRRNDSKSSFRPRSSSDSGGKDDLNYKLRKLRRELK